MRTFPFRGTALSLFAAAAFAFALTGLAHAAPSQSSSAPPSWVKLSATLDKTVFAPTDEIPVHLTATNTFKRGAYLKFANSQRYDLSVFPAGGGEAVYNWSALAFFLRKPGSLWLRPGQVQNYSATISNGMGQMKPGKYRLVARLTNEPHNIVAAPVNFEISAPKLALSARTDKTSYKIGESVKFDFSVVNRAKTPTTVTFGSGQTYDIFVFDKNDRQIWSYAANLRFIQVLTPMTWEAGETKKFSARWNGVPLPDETGNAVLAPGTYKISVLLASQPPVVAPMMQIEVTK